MSRVKTAYLQAQYEKLAEQGLYEAELEKLAFRAAMSNLGRQFKNIGRGTKNIAKWKHSGGATWGQAGKAMGKMLAKNKGAVGATAAGAAGLGYGMGDADTYENRMARMSNRNLGTRFGTQSRIGALFG